jgi:4a-hydroxytetrahydrobiopterin dehydratase
MRTKLSEEAISERLLRTPLWQREGVTIVRDLQVEDFAAALALVNLIGEVAEALDHHPDILLHGWNKIRLSVTTHDTGGLTERDFELAARVEELL